MAQAKKQKSLLKIEEYIGRRLEVVAFGISYVGFLEEVDIHEGFIKLTDRGNFAVLELERVDTYFPID